MQLSRTPLVAFAIASAACAWADEISFNDDIRPILSDRCFKCHGPDAENQKSEFRLDTREHAIADLGDGFFGIVPGNLEESDLHWRIWDDVEEDMMPPPDSNLTLTDEEKKLLDRWIEAGAPYDTHWSLKPLPKSVEVPESQSDWSRNEIDRFVENGFDEAQVKPAKESPREKWLRRVNFDLTGLPPTVEEIEAFLADEFEDAYDKVVDRLLASNAYAERMTSEWLDVARYSDSNGYQRDHERRVWPWRDWVIQAFQKNMPYDEFVTTQLAGDLFPDASQDDKLATAFNRLHGHLMEGGIVPEEYRVEYVADRTQTFGAAFLGLTLECSRCHDHKYDPLTTKEYYELSSFFANIEEYGLIAFFSYAVPTPALALSDEKTDKALAKSQKRIDALTTELDKLANASETKIAFDAWLESNPALEWPGRIAWLSFDERDGESFANAAAPDVPAVTPEINKLVPGILGQAIEYTGDDKMEVFDVGHFPREHPLSASVWVKPKQHAPRESLFSRGGGADDAASMGYEFMLMDGKPTASWIHFWPGNALRVQAKEKVPVGEWSHLTVSYDGSSKASGVRIYLNGQEMELVTIKDHLTKEVDNWHTPNLGRVREHLVLGERYRDRGFVKGQMDEFQMFDREISAIEARALYQMKSERSQLTNAGKRISLERQAELFEHFFATAYLPAMRLRAELQAARAEWNDTMDGLEDISVMREMDTPKPAYVLERGAYDSRGEEVFADTPSALPPFPADQPRNRLGLAHWLTDPDHPLTARVAVNRYWQIIFGEGLVRTPEDFGSQGSNPTHPELLDWLSRDFVDNGWDLHRLLRQMVLSATYRQSTFGDPASVEKDPENLTLSRSNSNRLAAEMIRDNALAVSGLLVDKIGGPPVKPYEVAVSFKPMEPDEGEGLYRRSLYTLWKRNSPAPMMVTFDAPKRDVCSLKREPTMSPLQPLVTLNGPQFIEAARVMGERLLAKHQGDRQAVIEDAFYQLTSRKPDRKETKILGELFAAHREEFDANPAEANALLDVGASPVSLYENPREHAAATVVINAIMNINESLIER
jgi:hypothetical protein